MHFTREPIIETVITPKEGYKIVIRNSSGSNKEEYTVDAVEVVSFGRSFFFRSLEKPKPFLVPVTDYEVVETRETRVVLKKATVEKSIKIGGGRPSKLRTEAPPQKAEEGTEPTPAAPNEKKKKRVRRRKKVELRETEPNSEEREPPPVIRKLLPPPPGLISEKMGRYKVIAEETDKEKPLNTTEIIPEPPLSTEGETPPTGTDAIPEKPETEKKGPEAEASGDEYSLGFSPQSFPPSDSDPFLI